MTDRLNKRGGFHKTDCIVRLFTFNKRKVNYMINTFDSAQTGQNSD